ncbi:hypothetical protein GGP41_006821 [Bipolaris sorokiniana]|uniref:Uncharacterized protein n=2 Tax=Cochliobolus sativus TaxID=45130 RepID=A0A8H5ZRV9_COCSA|nr:uncharacterized protein COCSADRAFT_36977 [Bipolaris sorokiniana ND90Pr]EMD64407.1 hypothetical protein COCSADRAFT_36977 [Bipolaris sorokiniana ND90Pr]KAF5854076.1 hypothetical protein GGP41_006821 [Bipolaris sorokiniana]
MFRLPNYSAPRGESIALSPYPTTPKSNVYAEEKDPFDALRRASATSEETYSDEALSPTSTWSNSTRPNSSPSPYTPETPVPRVIAPTRRQMIKSKTFPASERISRSTATTSERLKSILPDLLPLDDQSKTLRLQAPFIYETQSQNLPQYQLQKTLDRSSGPSTLLNIRRIQPHETRPCSVPAIYAAQDRRIRYDEEGTLYTISDFDMKGRAENALRGSIQLTSGKTLWGGQWTRIWHVTRCRARHSRCDYRGSCEPEKHLLFCIKKGVWEDAEGVVVGREESRRVGSWGWDGLATRWNGVGSERESRALEMTDAVRRDQRKSDLLVACWVMRLWMAGEFVWDDE